MSIQMMPREESYYQHIVEDYLGGSHMRLSNDWITDVTTSLVHAEIKRWNHALKAIGRLQMYNYVCHRPQLQVYLFKDMASEKTMQTYADVIVTAGIDVFYFEFKDTTSFDINIVNYHTKEIMYTHTFMHQSNV